MKAAPAALAALLALPSAVAAHPSRQAGSGSIVFVKRKNVYAYDLTTRVVTQLTHRRDAVGDVALSPDGTTVAYTASVARGTDIRLVALDGTGERDVTPWISPRLGAPLHTHVDPGWLDTHRLAYVDDQRAASAAVGRLQAVDLRTGAHGAVRGLPRALRSFVFEPVRISPAGIAYASLVYVGSGSHCEATEDLWLWHGRTTRLSRTPQAWESPLDVEPGLPVLGLRGKIVSGPHSGGCSYGKTTVAYEIRAFASRSSKRLVRFTPTSRLLAAGSGVEPRREPARPRHGRREIERPRPVHAKRDPGDDGRLGSRLVEQCDIVARDGAWRSLVSALVWGTRGPRFKSGRPDSKTAVSASSLGRSAKRLLKRGLRALGYELHRVGSLEPTRPSWLPVTRDYPHTERMANRAYRPPLGGQPMPLGGDVRVKYLLYFMDFRGQRVLELGPRDGHHSIMLEKMGAREIVAIEGRRENFEDCLRTKERYGLERTTFYLADIEELAAGRAEPPFTETFDVVFCAGLLYHLTDPGRTLDWCREQAAELFLQTHYVETAAAERYWPPHFQDGVYVHRGHDYRAKLFREELDNIRSGLSERSVWLSEPDLLGLIRQAGFERVSVLGKDVHAGLPHITVLAEAS